MTRQDFVDRMILSGAEEQTIKKRLELRDSVRTYAQELDDITEFASNTKHFMVAWLTTPFGEFPVFVDRDFRNELIEYMSHAKAYKGFSILDLKAN